MSVTSLNEGELDHCRDAHSKKQGLTYARGHTRGASPECWAAQAAEERHRRRARSIVVGVRVIGSRWDDEPRMWRWEGGFAGCTQRLTQPQDGKHNENRNKCWKKVPFKSGLQEVIDWIRFPMDRLKCPSQHLVSHGEAAWPFEIMRSRDAEQIVKDVRAPFMSLRARIHVMEMCARQRNQLLWQRHEDPMHASFCMTGMVGIAAHIL